VQVPAQYGPGEYEILVGLWDPATGRRYSLLGSDDGSMRYSLGTLIVSDSSDRNGGLRLVKTNAASEDAPGWNLDRVTVDFGPAITEGAFRCERAGNRFVVTPLPQLGPFSIALRPARLGVAESERADSIAAVDVRGQEIRRVEFDQTNGLVQFMTRRGEFAYRIGFDVQEQSPSSFER